MTTVWTARAARRRIVLILMTRIGRHDVRGLGYGSAVLKLRTITVVAPPPGGLYFRQVAPLLRAVACRHRIVGMDIVEIALFFDYANGLTCIQAGRLILKVLAASSREGGAFRREPGRGGGA